MQNAARRRRTEWPSREAAIENYGSKPPFNSWRRDLLELYVRHGVYDRSDGTVTLKCSGEDEAKMYAWGPRPLHSDEFLPGVQCPVLLISGEQSVAFPPAKARQAASMIPDCTLLTIPGTTHFLPFERPDAVRAAIGHFLGVE
jgi:pimeloyl-ACP methyl ester carboxylesterase